MTNPAYTTNDTSANCVNSNEVISAPPPPTTIHVENIDPTTLTAVKTVGHPKGTTVVNLREQQLKYKALVDNVAMQWNSLKYEYKRQRVPKNMLDDS